MQAYEVSNFKKGKFQILRKQKIRCKHRGIKPSEIKKIRIFLTLFR